MEVIIRGSQGEGKDLLKSFIVSMLYEYGIRVDVANIQCGEPDRGRSHEVIEKLQEVSNIKSIKIKTEQRKIKW